MRSSILKNKTNIQLWLIYFSSTTELLSFHRVVHIWSGLLSAVEFQVGQGWSPVHAHQPSHLIHITGQSSAPVSCFKRLGHTSILADLLFNPSWWTLALKCSQLPVSSLDSGFKLEAHCLNGSQILQLVQNAAAKVLAGVTGGHMTVASLHCSLLLILTRRHSMKFNWK